MELFALILFQIPEEVNHENKRRKMKNTSKALVLDIKKWLSLNVILNQRKSTGIFSLIMLKVFKKAFFKHNIENDKLSTELVMEWKLI